MRITQYRTANELWILTFTLLLILMVGLVTAGATFCLAPLFALIFIGISYFSNQAAHRALLQEARLLTPQLSPRLAALIQHCVNRLRPSKVQVFVYPSRQLNAYTFGFDSPQSIVMYSSLLSVMDDDELSFILGHEMGHVALGHTWLNTLVGGISGVPTTMGGAVVLTLAFRWWNRACEYSADRAGLLACGDLRKAVSALVKLVTPTVDSPNELEDALKVLDQEDDSLSNVLANTLSTHPMLIQRIHELRKYAASAPYRSLQTMVNSLG